MFGFSFYSNLLDDLSYITPYPPPWLPPSFPCHYSVTCGFFLIHPQYWGFKSCSAPTRLVIRIHWIPWTVTFIWFQNCFYRVFNKSIQIFAFGQALLSSLEPYAACAAATNGRPSRLRGFGLCQYDLARVHIVNSTMQGAHRWVFLLVFLFFSVLFQGVCSLVWPFSLRQLGGLVAFTVLLGFLFGDFLHLVFVMFPLHFRGAHRTRRALWGLGLRSQALGLWFLSGTPLGGRTLSNIGSRLLVGVFPRRKAETSQVTQPSRQCVRWICVSWCRGACKYPFWGTYSGAKASWEGKSGRGGLSSPTHNLRSSLSLSLEPSVRTLAGLLWQPCYASSYTSGVPWINHGLWWFCV